MSGYDGRTKGKRFRKPTTGNSNLRDRWKYLSADVDDIVNAAPKIKQLQQRGRQRTQESSSKPPLGYDIDGDGLVDIREMRLAKFLDNMVEKRRRAMPEASEVPESDLQRIRLQAGRLLIAKEFVERNQGQLWRYGSIFAEKNEDQSAEFIAEHAKFPKLMAFLESVERKRRMRSSCNVRGVINEDPHRDEPQLFHRQTWVESVRKVNSPAISKFPLPDLQPPRREVHPSLFEEKDNNEDSDIITNQYGAIDIDGDGVIDDDEMKINVRLKEAALDDPVLGMSNHEVRKRQQLHGRRMMARDFVNRNADKLWLYDANFKGRAKEDVVEEIASSDRFARDFNNLRAKERVLTLKSSMGVAECIVQMPAGQLPNDPQNVTEFRRVRDRSELLMARKELMKPPEQRMAALLAKTGTVPGTVPSLPFGAVREARQTATPLNRTRSESGLSGLPKIYDTPHRIEPIGSFSVTKWRFGDH